MTFSPEQVAALQAPLDRANVATRTQSGRSLSYIEGWHAIAEANRIFGFGNWHRETIEMRQVAERERTVGQGQGWGVSYLSRVRITVFADDHAGIVREGYGTGHGIDRDLGLAHESAAKEAETDAMKRALMTFGNPFGLALYDKTQSNVADAPPPPPAMPTIDPADFFLRWERMMKSADTLATLQQFKADTTDERAALKIADPEMNKRVNDAYKARQAAIVAATAPNAG